MKKLALLLLVSLCACGSMLASVLPKRQVGPTEDQMKVEEAENKKALDACGAERGKVKECDRRRYANGLNYETGARGGLTEVEDAGKEPKVLLALKPAAGAQRSGSGTFQLLKDGANVGPEMEYAIETVVLDPASQPDPEAIYLDSKCTKYSSAAFEGKTTRLKITSNGVVQGASPRELPEWAAAHKRTMAAGCSMLAAQGSVVLPEEPVGVGAKWLTKFVLELGTIHVRGPIQAELVELNGSKAHVKFHVALVLDERNPTPVQYFPPGCKAGEGDNWKSGGCTKRNQITKNDVNADYEVWLDTAQAVPDKFTIHATTDFAMEDVDSKRQILMKGGWVNLFTAK